MSDEIIPNLWLGDEEDARTNEYDCYVDVRYFVDFSNSKVGKVVGLAYLIEDNLYRKKKTLVHCSAGMERSPLAVATLLVVCKGMKFDEAYKLIESKRPMIQRREHWLGDYQQLED